MEKRLGTKYTLVVRPTKSQSSLLYENISSGNGRIEYRANMRKVSHSGDGACNCGGGSESCAGCGSQCSAGTCD